MPLQRWLLSPTLINFVFFVERWVFSMLFLYLGWEYLDTLRLMHLFAQSRDVLPAAMVARDAGLIDGIHFEDFARYCLLAASNLACGVLLLTSKKPSHYPTQASQIVVPLLATFSYAIFNNRTPVPAWMTTPFVPPAWSTGAAAAGLVFSAFGMALSFCSVLWLGRSLGIVVSVREVVLGGPYRYVRHPIYLGYFFLFIGLFLTACTVRMLILVLGAAVLLWWRARLEESLLASHSDTYRNWMKHTGFLWPRRPPVGATPVEPKPSPAIHA